MGYSFRYYGHGPADWYEGANDGHLFEILFRREPTVEEKRRLAATFERQLASGPARASTKPWLWARGFARFYVGERWSQAARMAFRAVTDFLMNAREIVPIEQVVFHGAREPGASSWERWTRAVQPVPTAGPPGLDPTKCHIDPALPAPTSDAAFEDERERTRTELRRARTMKASQQAAGLSLVLVEPRPAPAEAAVDWKAKFQVPEPAFHEVKYGNQAFQQRSDGDHVERTAPRPLAGIYRHGQPVGLAYLDDAGNRREVTMPAPSAGGRLALTFPDVSSDGTRAVTARGNELLDIDFETGVATSRWRAEAPIDRAIFFGERWAVKTASELYVLEPSDKGATIVASLKLAGRGIASLLGGAVLATSNFPKSLDFVGYCEGKLKKLASLETYLSGPREVDGEILYFQDRDVYRLDGLDEVYEAWARPLREKAEAARLKKRRPAKPGARSKPQLVETSATLPEPELVTPTPDDRARFPEHAQVHRSPSGRVAALLPRNAPANPYATVYYIGVAWIDNEGQHRELLLGEPAMVTATLSADGALFVGLRRGNECVLVDLETGGEPVHISTQGNELGFSPRSAVVPQRDIVVLQYEKGIAWWQRVSGIWTEIGRVSVPGLRSVVVNPMLSVACCLSSAKNRLVICGPRKGALKKLASFTERVRDVRSHDATVYALTVEGQAFEVTGLQQS